MLTIHPLFYIFGFYYALTGRIFVFVIYTITAVVHELGHSFAANGAGYKLNKITLMPFGAVVSGDIEGLKLKDEIKISLAGPFINLAVGLFFVAVWWLYPQSYAYTDIVAEANFSMALVNFLPIFPLDGGRTLWAMLALKLGRDKAGIISKVIGGAFSLALAGLFVLSLFYTPNLSLLFFALFVLFGAFGKGKDNKYIKVFNTVNKSALSRGLPVVIQAVSPDIKIKRLVSILEVNAVNRIEVYDGYEKIATLSQKRVEEIIEKGEIYSPLSKFL